MTENHNQPIANGLSLLAKWLLAEYQRVLIAGLSLLFLLPFGATTVLYLERIGYFVNIYQVEHEKLSKEILRATIAAEANTKQLRDSQQLLSNTAYYQQRTCVNTGTTQEERAKCLTKKRQLEAD